MRNIVEIITGVIAAVALIKSGHILLLIVLILLVPTVGMYVLLLLQGLSSLPFVFVISKFEKTGNRALLLIMFLLSRILTWILFYFVVYTSANYLSSSFGLSLSLSFAICLLELSTIIRTMAHKEITASDFINMPMVYFVTFITYGNTFCIIVIAFIGINFNILATILVICFVIEFIFIIKNMDNIEQATSENEEC